MAGQFDCHEKEQAVLGTCLTGCLPVLMHSPFWRRPELSSPTDGSGGSTWPILSSDRQGTARHTISVRTRWQRGARLTEEARMSLFEGTRTEATHFQGQSARHLIQAPRIRSKSHASPAFLPQMGEDRCLKSAWNRTGRTPGHMTGSEKILLVLWGPERLLSFPEQGCPCGWLVSHPEVLLTLRREIQNPGGISGQAGESRTVQRTEMHPAGLRKALLSLSQ